MDLESIRKDREALRERWYAEGWYGSDTLAVALARGAREHPDVPMVFHSAVRPYRGTIAEMDARSDALAGALQGLGIGRGDAVAVQLPTWSETAVSYHALMKLGAVLVPVVSIYGPGELSFILRQTRAKAVVLPAKWRGRDCLAEFESIEDLPDLEWAISIGERAPRRRGVLWSELEARGASPNVEATLRADDVAAIIYTSGTTSDPKGVKHTHNTLLADMVPKFGPPQVSGTFLNVWPAGHIGGLIYLMQPFMLGHPIVYMDRWDPEDAARLIEEHRVVRSGGTPIFLLTLLEVAKKKGLDLSSLKTFSMGGASITPEHVKMTDSMGFPGGRGYGSTEHPTVCGGKGSPLEKRAYTDGKLSGANEVRIVDDEGGDLPVGQDGELVSRGPELFVGYTDSRLDEDAFLPGGWYRTGDIAHLDEDGYITITDRKKDIIIRAGENISSKEVEEILGRHPDVLESAVTAMPDPTYGEKVCAFVILRDGVSLSLESVQEHFVAAGVARQKTPERLEVVEDFPRTASGKVKKFELREQLHGE